MPLSNNIAALPTKSGAYLIINWSTGRAYAGLAPSIRSRCEEHLDRLHRGVHTCEGLQREADRYGLDSFFIVSIAKAEWKQSIAEICGLVGDCNLDPTYNRPDRHPRSDLALDLGICENRLIEARRYRRLRRVSALAAPREDLLHAWEAEGTRPTLRIRELDDPWMQGL